MKPHGTRKERGAYFTPEPIARVLSDWAVRSAQDSVLEPAAGRGALLVPAIERLQHLGAEQPDVHAVELHRSSCLRLRELTISRGIPGDRVLHGDYFTMAARVPLVDAVVTNPPYVRHHDVPARAWARMRDAARSVGLDLSGKASSWAYFVVRACHSLKADGRLAAVLPFELLSTDYGRTVLEFVARSFRMVSVVRCSDGVFEDLQLRVVLLLAEGRALGLSASATVRMGVIESTGTAVRLPGRFDERSVSTAPAWLSRGRGDPDAEELLEGLRAKASVKTVGEISSVRIGYVSGGASFFQLSEVQRQAKKITLANVSRILARGSYADGVRFTASDWLALKEEGRTCWLLTPAKRESEAVRRLLANGVATGVHETAKALARDPWWQVPLASIPAAFVVYMGSRIRIVGNAAGVHAPNTLYTLGRPRAMSPAAIAAASMTSLFQLSVLMRVRDKGGGLSKLEPSDAGKALVPVTKVMREDLYSLDRLVRAGKHAEATELADECMLVRGLGWSRPEVAMLKARCEAFRSDTVLRTSAA